MFANMRQKLYTHEYQQWGRRGLGLCEEGGPLEGAWLGPKRNGNRFDHKQTMAYLGHWAALGEPPIECRAYGSVQQHADPSSVQTACLWDGNVGAGSEFRVSALIVYGFISRIDRARESRTPPRFLGKYAKNGYARCALYRLENGIYVSCSVHSNARVFHFAKHTWR